MVGFGPHEKLLETCETYKEIYDSQFKKESDMTKMCIRDSFRSGASQDVRDERSLQAQGEYRGNRCKRKEQCLRDN